jgi:hypothetical protein
MNFFVKDIEALRAALIVSLHAAAEAEFDRGTFYPRIDGKKVEFDIDLQHRVNDLLDEFEEAIRGA